MNEYEPPSPHLFVTEAINDSERKPLLVPDTKALKPAHLAGYGRSIYFQAVILFCISFLSFGSYFAYDSISSLETPITKNLNLSKFEFGFFYAVYTFPNVFLVLLGGYLIDKIGNRTSASLFCFLIVCGSLLVALAPTLTFFNNKVIFYLMLFGRFVFGLGAESSYVVQNSMAVEWFNGPHLAKAMGITISVSRLGSVLSYNVDAAINTHFSNYVPALWFAFLMCVFSFAMTMVYVFLDRYAKSKCGLAEDANENFAHNITLQQITQFSSSYWLALAIAITIYSSIWSFLAMSTDFLVEKWKISNQLADFYVSLIDITSLVMSPIFGWLVDRTGKRGWIVLIANSMAVVSYFLLGFTFLPPFIGIMLLGIHFSMMPSAIWPAVAISVDPKYEGTAFAIVSAFNNLVLTVNYPLSGYIGDHFAFTGLSVYYVSISAVSVILTFVWNVLDMKRPRPILNCVSQ